MATPPDRQEEREGKRQLGAELIIPALALAFTLYYFSTVWNSPWTAQVNAFFVGAILISVIVIFFIGAARDLFAGRASLSASKLIAPVAILPKRLGFMALTLAYLVLIHWLGYTLSTLLFLLGSMLLLGGGKRPLVCLIASLAMSGVGWLVFIHLFQKRLPHGPLEDLLSAVF